VETIIKMKASRVVFNCASCYHTFKHEYQEFLPGVELLHNTEYLYHLVKTEKIKLKGIKGRIAYHDPCDLGRGCGVFEPPREVIKAIPDIEYVELPLNRKYSTCCGGGGDMEMVDAGLVNRIAVSLVEEFEEAKVDIVATACPQCKRMSLNAIKAKESKVKVLDMAELVLEAGVEFEKKGNRKEGAPLSGSPDKTMKEAKYG
jgi:heterodisulfide reductase subunit D